ncbi:MAG TPA: response regulator transcription factor [Thermodesulfovibrionales bacterium]|nr:response regulator transcription factor [Thermodesulfovibrionales bacterium]
MLSIEVETMIKILVADDHAIVREGLKQILSQTPDLVVIAEASNGQEVIDKISKNDFNLVVLDITMPGKSGLEVLREIKGQKPKLPVLILSMYPEDQYAERVLKAGASGYLTKDSAPDELVKAIRQISQGKKYVTPSFAEKLAIDSEWGAVNH